MKVISVIEDEEVIKKILKHLGLWKVKPRPPPRANALPKYELSIDYSHRGVGPYGPEADSQLPVSDNLSRAPRPCDMSTSSCRVARGRKASRSNEWVYVDPEPAYT